MHRSEGTETLGEWRVWSRTEGRLSRVLARPQVLEGQQTAGVQGHQQLVSLHYVQAEGPGAEDDPLGLAPQGEDHAVLVLGQERQAGRGERGIHPISPPDS